MSTKSFYFRGAVSVYLQGKHALIIDNQMPGYLSYFLGSQYTNIKIRDFRREPTKAAQNAINGGKTDEFADVFSQPAMAKVRVSKGKIKIDMYDIKTKGQTPILWLGVVKDGESIPLAYVNWDVVKPFGKARNCFAALVIN